MNPRRRARVGAIKIIGSRAGGRQKNKSHTPTTVATAAAARFTPAIAQ
jgi:hypothetical protein